MVDLPSRYSPIPDTPERLTKVRQAKEKYDSILDEDDELIQLNVFDRCFNSTIFDSIYFYGPLVLFLSLLIGTTFYKFVDQWPLTTCFYFAAQALLGDMYAVPGDETSWSKSFTLCYFVYGEFLLAGALARFADRLIKLAPEIAADERKRVKKEEIEDFDGDGTIGCTDVMAFTTHNLLVYLDWGRYRTKYIYLFTLTTWILVGVLFGIYCNSWNWYVSLYYAVGAISTAGVFPPECIGGTDDYDCVMTPVQSVLAGTYIIIGVPLFELTMIEVVSLLVETSVRARERLVLRRPLTREEYQFASVFYDNDTADVLEEEKNTHRLSAEKAEPEDCPDEKLKIDESLTRHSSFIGEHLQKRYRITSEDLESSGPEDDSSIVSDMKVMRKIDLSDFIVLELLRMQRITKDELNEMKLFFDELDVEQTGEIDLQRTRSAKKKKKNRGHTSNENQDVKTAINSNDVQGSQALYQASSMTTIELFDDGDLNNEIDRAEDETIEVLVDDYNDMVINRGYITRNLTQTFDEDVSFGRNSNRVMFNLARPDPSLVYSPIESKVVPYDSEYEL